MFNTILNYSILAVLIILIIAYFIIDSIGSHNKNNENFGNDDDAEKSDIEQIEKDVEKLADKIKSETPPVVEVIKSANLPAYYSLNTIPTTNCGSNVNRLNCSTAPRWWYPAEDYNPDKFKEETYLGYNNPYYNIYGNAQIMLWDFKNVLSDKSN